MWSSAVWVVLGVLYVSAASTYSSPRHGLENGRLPGDLLPSHYNIEIQPDFYDETSSFNYTGKVEIWFTCHNITDRVYLNTWNHDISEASIQISAVGGAPDPVWTSWEVQPDVQFFILELESDLVEGEEYKIELEFETPLQPQNQRGIYWTSYEEDAQTYYVVTTQFESAFTRRGFPCFDEPHMKATFNLTVVRRGHMVTYANTPVYAQEPREGDLVADLFEATPVMAPYLVCFTIGEFSSIIRLTDRGTVVRIISRPSLIGNAFLAASMAVEIQEWFEEYTDLPDPLVKMDHIAIPNKGGAMENWGLITYEENVLLFDDDSGTVDDERRCATILAHELAHMWFGNLVTYQWFNEVWLNEGFASYFTYPPLEDLFGWSKSEMQYSLATVGIADSDSRNTSTAVRVDIDAPWDALRAFTGYQYAKAGALVRMIGNVLTQDTFRRAVQRYLGRHSYGNVRTDDLWEAFSEQAEEDGITDTDGSRLDMKEKFDSWVEQPGHPLLRVSRVDESSVRVEQERFLSPPGQILPPSPFDNRWNIPISVISESSPERDTAPKDWLDRDDEKEISDGIPGSSEWYVLNVGQSGFYRIWYDEENREHLVRQLDADHTHIPTENRAQLINDMFTLARDQHFEEVEAMEFTRYLSNERDFIPWDMLTRRLAYVVTLMTRVNHTNFQSYLTSLVEPTYTDLGWTMDPNGNILVRRLQAIMVPLACEYGVQHCVDEADTRFSNWRNDPMFNRPQSDYRQAVYCSGIMTGGSTDWDFVYGRLEVELNSVERTRFLNALACSNEQQILNNYIEIAVNNLTSLAEIRTALDAVARNMIGRDALWEKLKADWDTMQSSVKYSAFTSTVSGFATDEDNTELEAFIGQYPPEDETEETLYADARATMAQNLDWMDRNLASLDDWLQDNIPSHSR